MNLRSCDDLEEWEKVTMQALCLSAWYTFIILIFRSILCRLLCSETKHIEIQTKDPEANPTTVSMLAHINILGQWSLF